MNIKVKKSFAVLLFSVLYSLMGMNLAIGRGVQEDVACFECYALKLKNALVTKDIKKLKLLVGNDTLLDNDVIFMAIGDSNEKHSLRDIFNDDTIILVDSIVSNDSQIAIIYFVKRKMLKEVGIVGGNQVKDLRPFIDYFACEVVFRHGNFLMPDHFCYEETDLLEGGD